MSTYRGSTVERSITAFGRVLLICPYPGCTRVAGHLFDCSGWGRHSSDAGGAECEGLGSAGSSNLPEVYAREAGGGNPGAGGVAGEPRPRPGMPS